MSTSDSTTAGVREPANGAEALVIEVRPFLDADVQRLVAEVQQEYVVRYGGPDEAPVEPGQFAPPDGLFLLGLLDSVPVATGAWRMLEPGVAEIKRMYVAAAGRRRGVASRILAELELTATAAGARRLVLETGDQQPEAVAMYRARGYDEIEPYGYYRDSDHSICFAKLLRGQARAVRRASADPGRD